MPDARRPVLITHQTLKLLPLPALDEGADKEARGRVLVVGGSREIPGALVLTALAALRAGAGKLRIATCKSAATVVASHVLEGRVYSLAETRNGNIAPGSAGALSEHAAGSNAICVGSGMSDAKDAAQFIREFLPVVGETSLVIDANALAELANVRQAIRGLPKVSVLTPNLDELELMMGTDPRISHQALDLASHIADLFNAVVVVKGQETWIAGPGGRSYVNHAGNVGLATSGSGDVLSGIITGLAARGADSLTAAVWGVYVHALAGERLARQVGRVGYLARELLGVVPEVLDELER